MRTFILRSVAAAAVLAATQAGAADGQLVVLDWAGYDDPELYKSYVEKHGAPQFSLYGDDEEGFQKLRAGYKADVAHPCGQAIVKWQDAGLLEPIDTSRIAEWDNLIESFRNAPGFTEDGKVYALPADWGATAMTYRTDLVPAEDAATLQAFVDPKYQGRTAITENVRDAYALAYLATGVKDWTKATDEDFQKASDWLREAHKNVRTYWSDNTELAQLMASGEVALAWAWNETSSTLKREGHPVEMNRGTEEGSTTWVCGYVNLANGEAGEDKVYDFLNAWLEPRTAEYILTSWGYGHANEAGLNQVDPAVLKATGYDDFEGYRDSMLHQSPLPPEQHERMLAEFEKIKAGF